MTTQDTKTLAQFCKEHQIEVKLVALGERTDDKGWKHRAYDATLVRVGHGLWHPKINTPYKSGMGNKGKPTIADVLYSLLMDASCFRDSRDIDDYAAQFCEGLPISKTLELFTACQRTDRDLDTFLGSLREEAERCEH